MVQGADVKTKESEPDSDAYEIPVYIVTRRTDGGCVHIIFENPNGMKS
jgi:hypothetical protein